MTWLLIILLTIALVLVFSQFGGRISASGALQWWVVAFFLSLAAIDPQIYRSVADVLGIKFISNFVLAGMIMFLFYQSFEYAANSSLMRRRIRAMVAYDASRRYVSNHQNSSLSCLVVLPCFNEMQALPDMIRRLDILHAENPAINYVIVDDGSTDRSLAALEQLAPKHVAHHQFNLGVSGALLTGFYIGKQLKVPYVIQCDADGQHPVEMIPELLAASRNGSVDCLIGSRFCDDGHSHARGISTTRSRRLGGLLISWTLRLLGLVDVRITDPTSGFRVYSFDAIDTLLRDMPDEYPEPESIAILAGNGHRIKEHPVTMQPRMQGVSSLAGLKGFFFMVKVMSAILGLKLRTLVRARPGAPAI